MERDYLNLLKTKNENINKKEDIIKNEKPKTIKYIYGK